MAPPGSVMPSRADRAPAALVLLAGLVLLIVASFACNQEDPKGCLRDRPRLVNWLTRDRRAAEQLRTADALALEGKGTAAADTVDRARIDLDRAWDESKDWRPMSRWGARTRDQLVDLLEDRRRTMIDYSGALRSDDLARVVQQMEAQKVVERRALDAEKVVHGEYNLAGGDCRVP